MSSNKTRIERIEEAARAFLDNVFELDYSTDDTYRLERELREAIALPPDPPRGDGWEALRELRRQFLGEHRYRLVVFEIDRLLATEPKEMP